jgi:Colicin V production protein.
MTWDILIPVCLGVPILFAAWHGWTYGATFEFRHLLAHLFALLTAMWFWQSANQAVAGMFGLDARLCAAIAFVCAYAVAFGVAGYAVAIKAPAYRSVQANPFDQLLGAVTGLFTGSIIGGAIILILTLVTPPTIQLSETALVAREWPSRVFRLAERIAGIPADSPERALLPAIEYREERADPNAPPGENGMVMMRVIPSLVWK